MGIFSRFFHISHSLMMNCLRLFTFSFSTKTQWAPHLSTVILMGSLSSLWRQWKPVGMRDPSPLAAEWKSCNKTTALPRACWDESTALYLEISSLHQKGKSYCWNSRCIPQQHANRQQKSPEAASQLALGTREQSLGWLLLWMGKGSGRMWRQPSMCWGRAVSIHGGFNISWYQSRHYIFPLCLLVQTLQYQRMTAGYS